MSDTLEARIKEMLVEELFLTVSPGEIGDEDDLMRKFGVESVQMLAIGIALESRFGVSLEDSEFVPEMFATPRAIAEVVRERGGS